MKSQSQSGQEQPQASELITIKLTTKSDTFEVDVYPEDTIALVRAKIEAKHKLPHDAIMLKFNGQMLFPIRKVGDIGLTNGSTLELIVDDTMLALAKQNKENEQKEKLSAPEINLVIIFADLEKVETKIVEEKTIDDLIQQIKEATNLDGNCELILEQQIAKGKDKLSKFDLKKGSEILCKRDNEVFINLKRMVGTIPFVVGVDKTILELKEAIEKKENIKKGTQTIKK